VSETGQCLGVLLHEECQPAVAQLADALADWYKMAQTVYLQVYILDKDLDTYEKRLEAFSRHLRVTASFIRIFRPDNTGYKISPRETRNT